MPPTHRLVGMRTRIGRKPQQGPPLPVFLRHLLPLDLLIVGPLFPNLRFVPWRRNRCRLRVRASKMSIIRAAHERQETSRFHNYTEKQREKR